MDWLESASGRALLHISDAAETYPVKVPRSPRACVSGLCVTVKHNVPQILKSFKIHLSFKCTHGFMISERSCPTVTRLPEVSVCSDMQEATATEALATDTGIKLSALPSDKEKNQAEPPAPSHGSHAIRSIQTKSSPADSCDLEEGTTAGNSKGKTVSESVRSTVRDIKSNKIGRRTLQATVIIGILTLLYQFISLSPAFQALQVQIQGEVDSRQSVAYGFLSGCANRKVRTFPCCFARC